MIAIVHLTDRMSKANEMSILSGFNTHHELQYTNCYSAAHMQM